MLLRPSLCMTAVTATLAALLLTACERDNAQTTQSATEAGKNATAPSTASPAIIHYASTKDIRDINPHLYLGEMSAQAMVFEPLVINTADGVKPWLAKSWEISEDGRHYTFHLREGITFTDGTPFDANAVDMNIRAVLANRTRHAWLDFVNEIEATRVVDAMTWELTLKHPYYPTLIELGVTRPFRFISPACMKEANTKDGVNCLVGTGPWILKEHVRNQFARFERNAHYWGEAPKVDGVLWKVMPDVQTMLLALQKGEIDLIFGADGDQITSDAFSALEKGGTKLMVKASRPIASRAILFNSSAPITADAAVREALQRAINRDAIVNGVLNGAETAALTLFARNVPGCDVDLAARPYDPAKAEALLDEAGWKRSGQGVRSKNGHALELNFYFNSQNAQEKTIAQAIQGDLAKIGVTLNVIGEEKQAFLDRQRNGQFDLQYSLSWGAPYDPQSYFSSWRIPSHGDYQAQRGLPNKAEIDATITQLMTEPNEKKRQLMTHTLLRTIHDSAVYFPISYSRTKAVYTPRLDNVEFALSQYEIPFERMRIVPLNH